MKDLLHGALAATLLLSGVDCGTAAAGSARDRAEIAELKAKLAKLEAAAKPSCDKCITPESPEEYAPNKTCKIERTWRRISETPERYELIGGRWYLIIREEWTWSDRIKCETVKPR